MAFSRHPLILAALLLFAASAHAYNIDTFLSAASRASSVEQALGFLPAEMRENYTLQHTAIAFQGASYENPRVLTFTEKGDLVLAFNGEESQPGYETIEAIQFRRDTKTFELFEIEFSREGPIVNRNPPQCLGCHGRNPTPLWHNYGTWKRFFGSDEANPDSPTGDEAKYLKQFNARVSAGSHARYKILKPRALGRFETTPFAGIRSAGPEARDLYFSPNFRLGMFLKRNASLAVSAQLAKHPLYKEYLPLTFYVAACTNSSDSTRSIEMPERGAFLRQNPTLAAQYDRTAQNLRSILLTGVSLNLAPFKYFKYLGIDPAKLVLQPEASTRTDRFFDDGLASRVTKSMVFYPGELLTDLKRLYPGSAAGFERSRNEPFYQWTSSPAVLDRLDEITQIVTGGDCQSLWPLIVKTMSEVSVSSHVTQVTGR